MPNIKRLTDLTDYKSVLPYASEIFGVYQPLIGWNSTRKANRIKDAVRSESASLLSRLGRHLLSDAALEFTQDCFIKASNLTPARLGGPRLLDHRSIVLQQIQSSLRGEMVPA